MMTQITRLQREGTMKRLFSLVCAVALCGCIPAAMGAPKANAQEKSEAPQANVQSFPQAASVPSEMPYEELSEALPETEADPIEALEEAPVQQAEVPAAQEAASAAPGSTGEDYLSPLVTLRADPYLYKHEGVYYFTGSYPQYDRIELTSADSVNGIAAAVPKEIWHMDANFGEKYVWAPEIHYIMGQWVIYFAYSQGSLWSIKCCALRCNGQDPMHDPWEYMGVIKRTPRDGFSFNSGMSLDMTVYYHDAMEKWYAIWAQKPGSSNLYIAELADPFTLATEPMLLTRPDYDWERVRENVNEGPAVLKHAGKIFVSFSAAATGYEYCMGLLEINAWDDPMVKSNWKKYEEPVFQTDEGREIYGPGHNCFVEGDNGEQLCILHFRNYKEITGDSLLDFNRHAHVMKITYDIHGVPQFSFADDDLYNTEFQNHNK